MIAIDTNILVYAHRTESRFHEQAKVLVKGLAEGASAWAIPWPCVYEFFSVVTHPRIWKGAASSPNQAADQLDAWTGSPSLALLGETQDFGVVLTRLIRQPRIRGPIMHDARIAAICLAHGVGNLLTRDRDFHLFPQLKTTDPFSD